MEWLKSLGKGGGGKDKAESSSSSDESSANGAAGAGDAAESSNRVTFELIEPSAANAAAEPSENNASGMMDMAYLTQPDPMVDNSSDDENENDESDDGKEEEEQDGIGHNTPQQPNKKGRGRRRALKQGGDALTQLQASPEGREHSSTSKKKISTPVPAAQGEMTSLSQQSDLSPLRSPSPLTMMSQETELSPQPDSARAEGGNDNAVSDCKASANLEKALDLDVKDAKPTPKDAMDIGESAIDNDDKPPEDDIDFGSAEPVIDDDDDEPIVNKQEQQKQRILHKMNMKKQAIHRSLLHLSDNSYSFVYDESNGKNGNTSKAMNNDDEPGLPYIGPDLKENYELLRTMLRKGLLGRTNDDIVEDDSNKKSNGNEKTTTLDGSMEDTNDETVQSAATLDSNPFLPKFRTNVSAVLMGPRGHGKSLVLERCLASLSRLASKRKDHVLEQVIEQQQDDKVEEMYSQASFRVVRINGLLFQGDSAVACTREISRQIGVMSREERKRTRRIVKQMGVKRKRSKLQSSELETPTPSSRKRKKNDRSARKSGQRKLSLTSPATPALSEGAQTPDNPTANNESHDLRIRSSGFNTYIAHLDEVLRTARIDGIPILIVLEELDTFLTGGGRKCGAAGDPSDTGNNQQQDGGNSDRQLLLYHLLDRVADHKFLVSMVGMTTDLKTVTKLEKRVQSRAEGTSKIIYFGHNKDFDDMAKSLLGKFYTPPERSVDSADEDEYNEQRAMIDIREQVEAILRGAESNNDNNQASDQGMINDFELVQRVLQRNYSLIGSDMRWVCRVFDVALGLLASDIDENMCQCMENGADDPQMKEGCDSIPKLNPRHMAQALVTMSASLDYVSGSTGHPGIPTTSSLEIIRWGQLMGDPKHYSCLLGTHSRLITLLDLSGPQVAILLAARRIAARDDTRANAEDDMEEMRRKGSAGSKTTTSTPLPLTYQRIKDEYTISFVASGRYTISSDRYPPHVLYRSCMDLMELDIVRSKKEQCGGGALQYDHNDILSAGTDIANIRLHINLDWDLEFMDALKAGLLQCSTALREWGMKMN